MGSRTGRGSAWAGVAIAVGLTLVMGCRDATERRAEVARSVYDRHCAGCHGVSETGPTPVSGLGFEPADLRRLHERYGRPLDRDALARYIDGRHVDRGGAMPVWGDALYDHLPESVELDEMRAGTIGLLIDYLESIQQGS